MVPDIYFLASKKLEFSRHVLVNQSDTKFHEKPPVGIEFFHADRTDVTKLMAAIHNFANEPIFTFFICPQPPEFHFSSSPKTTVLQRNLFSKTLPVG
jgi:hypothetical protein